MKLGCIQIPATAQLQKKDIAYRISASEAKLVICVGEDEVCEHTLAAAQECGVPAACLGGAREGFLDFSRLMEEASDAPALSARPNTNDDIMLMYFTSGTTGMPKMVAHRLHLSARGTSSPGAFWHNLDENSDLHLTAADTGWAQVRLGQVLWPVAVRRRPLFVYDFDRFHRERFARHAGKIPRHLVLRAAHDLPLYALRKTWLPTTYPRSTCVTTAGEAAQCRKCSTSFKEFTGVELLRSLWANRDHPSAWRSTPKWMAPKPGSIGKPSPHYHIRLLDTEGRDVEPGEEGEICVDISQRRPAGLFVGYYKDEERTREAFAGGVYRTGDMAWCDEEGYYWFIGRADDVIKSSGYRIGPFEVESALISHPAVVECAITGVPDPDRGQVVKATVVLAKGYEPSDELRKELQRHVKQVTAPYKYPRILEFVEELPKTVSGKIQRAKLRKEDEAK